MKYVQLGQLLRLCKIPRWNKLHWRGENETGRSVMIYLIVSYNIWIYCRVQLHFVQKQTVVTLAKADFRWVAWLRVENPQDRTRCFTKTDQNTRIHTRKSRHGHKLKSYRNHDFLNHTAVFNPLDPRNWPTRARPAFFSASGGRSHGNLMPLFRMAAWVLVKCCTFEHEYEWVLWWLQHIVNKTCIKTVFSKHRVTFPDFCWISSTCSE